MSIKVLLATSSFASRDEAPFKRLSDKGYEIIRNPYGRKLSKDELIKLLPGVTGIIAGLETLDREVLQKSSLKAISRCGSGLSNIDLDAARDLQISVLSTPNGPVESVAELTVGAMLSLIRHLFIMDTALHYGKWEKRIGIELRGKAVAIIGFGKIGRRVAELLKPFGANMVAVDPNLSGNVQGIPIVDLPEAFKLADIITLHSSGESILIGKSEFQKMKPGIFLLNAARGGLVDETALIDALKSELVAGAWLDCFSEEPYNGPLQSFSQVILTPHAGSYTVECRRAMELEAADNLISALEKR